MSQGLHQPRAGRKKACIINGDQHCELRQVRRRGQKERDSQENQKKLPRRSAAPTGNLKQRQAPRGPEQAENERSPDTALAMLQPWQGKPAPSRPERTYFQITVRPPAGDQGADGRTKSTCNRRQRDVETVGVRSQSSLTDNAGYDQRENPSPRIGEQKEKSQRSSLRKTNYGWAGLYQLFLRIGHLDGGTISRSKPERQA